MPASPGVVSLFIVLGSGAMGVCREFVLLRGFPVGVMHSLSSMKPFERWANVHDAVQSLIGPVSVLTGGFAREQDSREVLGTTLDGQMTVFRYLPELTIPARLTSLKEGPRNVWLSPCCYEGIDGCRNRRRKNENAQTGLVPAGRGAA
jgi:hypothetical protein